MATTTLTGTTGNNLLNAPGSVSTLVQGLQGNDTINLALVNDEAQGGQGDDTIALVASGTVVSTVFGGDGADTVNFVSATTFSGFVDLGAGNDSVALTGALNGAQIYGNEGSDTIALANQLVNSTIGAGSGTDIISFSGGQTITTTFVQGGRRQDTITIQNAAASFSTIIGGNGSDLIRLSGVAAAGFASTNVGGGKGTDSITVGANAVASVSGGGLADTINLSLGFAGGRIYGDGVGVTTAGTGVEGAADGNDSVAVGAALTGATSIYGAGGADTIFFATGIANLSLVDGGNGSDSLRFVGTAADHIIGSINGGAGNDTISIASQLRGVTAIANVGTINGGAGNDSIVFSTTAVTDGGYFNAVSQLTALSNVGAVVAGVNSGDRVAFGTTAFGSLTQANWLAGAPTIFVASTLSALSAGMDANTTTTGSIGVFSDGTDSVIAISRVNAGTSFQTVFVDGKDLVLTNLSGQNVTYTASNFAFTVAAIGTTGLSISFS